MFTILCKRAIASLVLASTLGIALTGCAPGLSPQAPTGSPTGVIPVSNIAQSEKPRLSAPQIPAGDLSELSAGNSAFALDFYQAVRSQDGNLFYSPYSISLALAMTYAGARGETETQMAQTLHFSLPQDRLHPAFNALDQLLASRAKANSGEAGEPFKLNIANSIWAQQGYPFLPQYLDLLAGNYGAGLRLADFSTSPEASRQAINQWVSQQTEDRIKDLIPQGAIDSLTRMVLANAIYFKASWLYPFGGNLTQEATFNRIDGGKVSVPMMSLPEPASLPYAQGQGYQAVELPYSGDQVSMLLLVPDAGKFAEFEASLNESRLESILSELKPQSVALSLPKFKFESSFGLANTLASLGMPDAFDVEKADFSGMDGEPNLFITKVLHKAFIAVDENGTEAAAATAVIMGLRAMPLPGVELKVDRPFIFVIRDKPTSTLLFVGRVLDPAE